VFGGVYKTSKMRIEKIEAVIFDMDGLLVDSEPFWKMAEIETFKELGFEFTIEMCEMTVGWRVDEVVSYWLKKFESTLHIESVVEVLLQKLYVLIEQNAKPMTGVVEILEFFKEKKIPMAVATSSPEKLMHKIIDTLNITQYFEILVSAQHLEFGKPHPAVFIEAAKFLKTDTKRCLVFEDSINGLIAAKAAKMHCVCVPEPKNFENKSFALSNLKIKSLLEFNEVQFENLFVV
jgi:mannitol-1-/sugar-/sorbitol-6-/2-deoxyglucose-6-phosphatase